jgi:hypothetical protein
MIAVSLCVELSGSVAAASAISGTQIERAPENGIVGGNAVVNTQSFEYKHTARLLIAAVTEGADLPPPLRGLKISWRCSAAILSTTVLVSAAHCFPKIIGLKDSASNQIYRARLKDLKLEAFFKTDPRKDQISGIFAKKVVVHEGFRDDWVNHTPDVWNPPEPVNDVALIQLQSTIPNDKSPVELLSRNDKPLNAGDSLVMAGYGRDLGDEQISLPRLRSVTVPFRESLRNRTEFFAGQGDILRAGRVERPAGGCLGDSGGPVFIERGGLVRLAGLIVRGPDDANGGCAAAVTISTSLTSFSDWISARLKDPSTSIIE